MRDFVFEQRSIQISLIHKHLQHRVVLGAGARLERLRAFFEQAKAFTDLHMLVLEVAGRRRQIVRVDGRERIRAPMLRRGEHTVHLLEPFHGAAEDAVFGKRVLHVIRHNAQILADDDATDTARFDREDAKHHVVVVVHVGAVDRRMAFRDPPQAEQA